VCQIEDLPSHKFVSKNVGATRKEEVIPLLLAAKNGDMAMVEKLLKAGVKVDGGAIPDDQETLLRITPLFAAALAGHAAPIAVLFEGGCQDEQNSCWRLHASLRSHARGA
jgi:hypothetical protein